MIQPEGIHVTKLMLGGPLPGCATPPLLLGPPWVGAPLLLLLLGGWVGAALCIPPTASTASASPHLVGGCGLGVLLRPGWGQEGQSSQLGAVEGGLLLLLMPEGGGGGRGGAQCGGGGGRPAPAPDA